MFKKIKQKFLQFRCRHMMDVNRWHWVHYPDYEPVSVEVEYKCEKCGKIDYIHLTGRQAVEWAAAMGDYKKA